MKTSLPPFASAGLLCAALALAVPASAGDEGKPEKKETASISASIRVNHAVKPAELPALAKITFAQALTTALARVPGGVIKAELEVEDGNLMYSFEIVDARRKILEVEIDAGTGKVLDVDED
jgi:uncharacterized membrane protein YkoI